MRKYVTVLSIVVLLLLSLGGTVKEDVMALDTNAGAIILKEKVSKLSRGMTNTEVIQLIGEPLFDRGFGRYIPTYLFADGETLTLDFGVDNRLIAARNKDGFDLLATEYTAKVADFSVLIDNEQVTTSNPVVTINNKAYIPVKEVEEQLGIEVEWNEEEKAVKIMRK